VVRGGYGGARTILELELRAPAANAGTRLARNTRDELNITRFNNAGLLFHAFFQHTVENMWTKSVLSRCTVYRITFGKRTITTARLAHFAAEAVGADMCPKIEKDSNDVYNKTALLTMNNNS
jgi:hypothetical protein